MKSRPPRNYDKPPGTMVLGLDVVLSASSAANVDRSSLRPPDVALLDLIDGKRTIEEVLQLSQTSWFVAMRRLRSLCERGILAPNSSGSTPGVSGSITADGKHGVGDARPRTVDLSDVVGKVFISTSSPTTPPSAPPRRDPPAVDEGRLGALAAALARPQTKPMEPLPTEEPSASKLEEPSFSKLDEPSYSKPGVSPAPGAPAAAAPSGKRHRAFKLGRYEVVTRIGQGGMGSVYLARQPGHWGFQRLFTLKVIREHAAEDKEAMRSFMREARVGGLLNHPNILGVVDVGNYKGQPFLVMDYVEGATLSELIGGSQPPPPALVMPVLLDALRGLQSAHEQADARGAALGIVHCDVSPHNIIVGLDGAARITDFGSARLSGEPVAEGEEDLPAVGKPGYMSPEQLCGNPIDARTDIFAMGVVMWTALTGKKLFADPSYEQTIINVLRKKVDAPSMFGSPASLDDVCLRALARAPESRYQTAEEMRLAIHRVASREAMLASTAEISRWVKRTAGDALEERRRRILSTISEPEGGEAAAPTAPAEAHAHSPTLTAAQAADPERFRPTVTIATTQKTTLRRRNHGHDASVTVETEGAREIENALRRRPWVIIVLAAIATAVAAFSVQGFLRTQRPPPRSRPAVIAVPDAAPLLGPPPVVGPEMPLPSERRERLVPAPRTIEPRRAAPAPAPEPPPTPPASPMIDVEVPLPPGPPPPR
jgi:serine/threonine-protein kinase